jgi:two-component system response regulator
MVDDGEAALAFLHQRPPLYTAAPRPTFIILDIHLPKYNGWDVLAVIRTLPALTNLLVVMLTGEMGLFDAEQREQLKPNLCLLKPCNLGGYRQLAKSVTELVRQHTSAV